MTCEVNSACQATLWQDALIQLSHKGTEEKNNKKTSYQKSLENQPPVRSGSLPSYSNPVGASVLLIIC